MIIGLTAAPAIGITKIANESAISYWSLVHDSPPTISPVLYLTSPKSPAYSILPCVHMLTAANNCVAALRQEAFFQCFKLCLKLLYHARKINLCEKWRCRSAAGGVLRRQAFFQCFKQNVWSYYTIANGKKKRTWFVWNQVLFGGATQIWTGESGFCRPLPYHLAMTPLWKKDA